MKRIILILSWSLLFNVIEGQTTYNILIDHENQGEWGNSIFVDDSAIMITGTTNVLIDSYYYDGIFFRRLDFNGNILFEKFFGKINSVFNFTNIGNSLFKTDDENYISGGTTQFYDIAFPGEIGSNGIIYKFNYLGDTVWTAQFNGLGFTISYGFGFTTQNEFLLVGLTQDTVPTELHYNIIKTDSSGAAIWEKIFQDDVVNAIFTADSYPNGDIILGATSDPSVYLDNGEGHLIKLDSTGEIIWDKNFGTTGDDNSCGAYISIDEQNILLIQSIDTTINAGDYEMPDYVAKLDSDGNFIWQEFFNGPARLDIWNILEIQNKEIMVIGSQDDAPTVNGFGYICKLDSNGNKLWERTYYSRPDRNNWLVDIKQMVDGGFILTGSAYNELNNQDVWLLRLDCMGCLEPGCDGTGTYTCDSILPPTDTTDTTITIKNLINIESTLFKIYPNPIINSATAEIKIPNDFEIQQKEKLQLNIYDMTGKLIDTYSNIQVLNTGQTIRFNIYKGNKPSGLYSAQLIYGINYMGTVKIIVD